MSYKYTMISLEQKFIIFILYYIYIFKSSFSRIFLYLLFPKKYLFKHHKAHTSIKKDILQVLVMSRFGLSRTKYKLSTILAKKNRGDWYD